MPKTAEEKRRYAIAQHEATHAVAALTLGLPVAWVSIEDGLEEGVRFTAAVQIPDELIDVERDRFAVLVAMAAPSHLPTYDDEIDRYARLESIAAYRLANKHGLDSDHVYDEAATITGHTYGDVHRLAERLVAEGRVVFEQMHASVTRRRVATPLGPMFEGVHHVLALGYRIAKYTERRFERWNRYGSLPRDLTHLRSCLFILQRAVRRRARRDKGITSFSFESAGWSFGHALGFGRNGG